MSDLFKNSGATFSGCGLYRYKLWRSWDTGKAPAMFLMLNPSTADAEKNDPTVERCERYARSWGYGGLLVCNLFAYRATDPKDMKMVSDPVGPDNNAAILDSAEQASIVVGAWGNHGSYLGRAESVRRLLRLSGVDLYCLKITKLKQPSHPLYLRKELKPILFDG